jgi:WD40 repeat protein
MRRTFLSVLSVNIALVALSVMAFIVAQRQIAKASSASVEAQKQMLLASEATKEAERQKTIAGEETRKSNVAHLVAEEAIKAKKLKTAEAERATELAKDKTILARAADGRAQQAEAGQQLAEKNASSVADASKAVSLLNSAPEESVLVAARAFKRAPTEEAELALRRSLFASSIQTILRGHQGPVVDVSFDEAGRLVVTGGADKTVRVWDPEAGNQLAELGTSDAVTRVSISLNGQYVAAVTDDEKETVLLWEWKNKTTGARSLILDNLLHVPRLEVPAWVTNRPITVLAFSPDNHYVATAGWHGILAVWETSTGKLVKSLRQGAGTITSVAFSSNGEYLLSAGMDGQALLWTWQSEDNARVLPHPQRAVGTARFGGPNDELIVTTNFLAQDKASARPEYSPTPTDSKGITDYGPPPEEVWVWRTRDTTKEPVAKLAGAFGITDAILSRDGNLVIARSQYSRELTTWSWKKVADRSRPRELRGHTGFISDATISSDGYIVSASQDYTARIWRVPRERYPSTATGLFSDPPRETPLAVLRGHGGPVLRVAITLDGKLIATASADATVRIWKTQPMEVAAQLTGPIADVWNPPLSPDASGLVLQLSEGDLKVLGWQGKDNSLKILSSLKPGTGSMFRQAQFSPDGNTIAVVVGDGSDMEWCPTVQWLFLWSWRSHSDQSKPVLVGEHDRVGKVVFSHDGRYVITTNDATSQRPDTTAIRVWDWKDEVRRNKPVILSGHTKAITDVTFSNDDRYIVSAGGDGLVRVWDWRSDIQRQKPIVLKSVGGAELTNLAISADGKYIAALVSGFSLPVTALVWEWQSEEGRNNPLLIGDEPSYMASIAFSPDDKMIITGGTDGDLHLWDRATGVSLTTVVAGLIMKDRISFIDGGRFIFAPGLNDVKIYSCSQCAPANELLKLVRRYVSSQTFQQRTGTKPATLP